MGGGWNACVCGTALPADLRWVGYSGPCRACSRPVVVPPPVNYTDPLLVSERSDGTVRALVFEPILHMDWFTADTGAFYSNDWLVLQSDEKFQIFEIETTLNLLAQRYDRLKSGAVRESRITRRWDISRAARATDDAERRRELDRLERAADLILTAVDESQPLGQVSPDPEHGRKRLQDRAEQIRKFQDRMGAFAHLVDLFDARKAEAWEGEPRYSGVSRVHDLRALRQIVLGRWQQASEELERAIRCDPDDPVPRQHRLLVSARLGRLEQGESDADWLVQRRPEDRAYFVAWRSYFRFCRDRLEEAKSDARVLFPGVEGDELAEKMSQLLREREEMAHAQHDRWLIQFNVSPGPSPRLPPVEEPKPIAKAVEKEVVEQALVEAAEMGGGRILMGPGRLGSHPFMVVVQPGEGSAYCMMQAPNAAALAVTAHLRAEEKGALCRRQFTFPHRGIDHQIDVCVRLLEGEAEPVEFAEVRVTPMRRGADAYQPPSGTARPVRTALLGFLESGVADTMADKLNSALVRGLTAFNSIPIVRGRTLAYAGITLNDATEDMGGTLAKIRGEFNAQRFIYARLDAVPEAPDSGLLASLTLVLGDAWINHAESIRTYGLYDRDDLESAVELAAQDFARHLKESDLVPETTTGPEFPPADPRRRVAWLKLMAGYHELRYDRARAVQYLRQAVELDRADLRPKTALALLLQIEGDAVHSESLLRAVAERLDDAPSSARERAKSRLRLARALTAQEDFSRAQAEIVQAGRFSEEDPELAAAAQRALRYLGLEALEQSALPVSIFSLGRALGETLVHRDSPQLPADAGASLEDALVRHYESVLRLKIPSRVRALLDKLHAAENGGDYADPANRLWLEIDRVIGEDLGVRGRSVLRLGRLFDEIRALPEGDPQKPTSRAAWAWTGLGWIQWLAERAPAMYLAGLGGRGAFPEMGEGWKNDDLSPRFIEGLSRVGASTRDAPAATLEAQPAVPDSWTAPHLELVPLPHLVVLDDGRVVRLREGRYQVGRPDDPSFASMLAESESIDPSRHRAGGWFVSSRGRRGIVDLESPELKVLKFLIERGRSLPMETRLFVPPLVRIVFWKSKDVAGAPPIPELLDKWLFEAGVDEPRVSPPWITLPSGKPRGWRCREAWGEFIPEDALRFSDRPSYWTRKDQVYAVMFFPVFGGI